MSLALLFPRAVTGSTSIKTGSGQTDQVASGADSFTGVETATVATEWTGGNVDSFITAETGTAPTARTGSGADAFTATKTGMGVSAWTADSRHVYAPAVIYTKTGMGVSAKTGSGADSFTSQEVIYQAILPSATLIPSATLYPRNPPNYVAWGGSGTSSYTQVVLGVNGVEIDVSDTLAVLIAVESGVDVEISLQTEASVAIGVP